MPYGQLIVGLIIGAALMWWYLNKYKPSQGQ